jgi:hypothetical protein
MGRECECGGRLQYVREFGRLFSRCERCTKARRATDMGQVKNVGATTWPRQGRYLGSAAVVRFWDEQHTEFPAVIVRDDAEAPWITVLRLDGGRVVLSTECMYSPRGRDGRL